VSVASGSRVAALPWQEAVLRWIAAGVDGLAAGALAALLSSTSGVYFAQRAVETFRIGRPETVWKGPVPMLLGAVSTLAYGVAFALLLVWLTEALFGTSPGKLLVRREIATVPRHRWRALWKRFALKASGAWLFCLALALGSWPLVAAAGLATGVVVLGFLPVPFGRQALHDRLASTTVRTTRVGQAGVRC